ncbi:MAG: hypothetical protein NVS2B12_23160 [Ktedonobacteraceae bacterium]
MIEEQEPLNVMPFSCVREGATVELKKAEQWRRTGAIIRALSLTQLNSMLDEKS